MLCSLKRFFFFLFLLLFLFFFLAVMAIHTSDSSDAEPPVGASRTGVAAVGLGMLPSSSSPDPPWRRAKNKSSRAKKKSSRAKKKSIAKEASQVLLFPTREQRKWRHLCIQKTCRPHDGHCFASSATYAACRPCHHPLPFSSSCPLCSRLWEGASPCPLAEARCLS